MADEGRSTDQTIEQVTQRPGAVAVLQRFGIDHCCLAHLSLHQAAAAAGVDVAVLMDALARDTAPTVTLDVRGLEPPQPMVRVLERLATLGEDDTLEVIHSRRPVFLYPQLDQRGFVHATDEPEPGVVRIVIRRRSR